MILTSNRAIEEWYALFPDDLLASAANDCLLRDPGVVGPSCGRALTIFYEL